MYLFSSSHDLILLFFTLLFAIFITFPPREHSARIQICHFYFCLKWHYVAFRKQWAMFNTCRSLFCIDKMILNQWLHTDTVSHTDTILTLLFPYPIPLTIEDGPDRYWSRPSSIAYPSHCVKIGSSIIVIATYFFWLFGNFPYISYTFINFWWKCGEWILVCILTINSSYKMF